MDPALAEIAVATVAQLAGAIAIVATLRANQKNLTEWVEKLDEKQAATHDIALTTSQRVRDLPCRAGAAIGD